MLKSCTNVTDVKVNVKENFSCPITRSNRAISITCANVTEVTENAEFLHI